MEAKTVGGRGGWVRVEIVEPELVVYTRCVADNEDGWVVAEAVLDGQGRALTPAQLRAVPFARKAATLFAWRCSTGQAGKPGDDWMRATRRPTPDVAAVIQKVFVSSPTPPPPVLDPSARLSSPTEGLTPVFLRQVAAAYLAAVDRGERPNVELAGQVGHRHPDGRLNTRTVERWVYLARKRGFLPKGRPGAVG